LGRCSQAVSESPQVDKALFNEKGNGFPREIRGTMADEDERLCSKLRDLLGRREMIDEELKVQKERVDVVRTLGENLVRLAEAQGRMMGVQLELMDTYKGLCGGGQLDDNAALVFRQNILFVLTGSLPIVSEQAVLVSDDCTRDDGKEVRRGICPSLSRLARPPPR
jgi:hypothetical protein